MRRLIVSEFLTLDGVMQAPGLPDEDRSGGFEHGGWWIPYQDEVAGAVLTEGLNASGGMLLGRVTYEIFAGHWPTAPDDDPIAPTVNRMPKYVVSSTLQEPLDWANSHVIAGDVPGQVQELKDEDGGDLGVIGSGGLVQTLIEEDLIDEYRLMVVPLVLGTGKRLFREETGSVELELVDSKTSSTGVLIATYRPAKR